MGGRYPHVHIRYRHRAYNRAYSRAYSRAYNDTPYHDPNHEEKQGAVVSVSATRSRGATRRYALSWAQPSDQLQSSLLSLARIIQEP